MVAHMRKIIKTIVFSCVLICACLISTACSGNANLTETEDNIKITASEKVTNETTASQESTTQPDSSTAETTKPESTTKSKTSNEEKTQSSENTSGSESSKQNATYSKDKVTFIFKDNSGNVIEGIDVVIQPHANEGSAHTDIAEVVGTSDKNGAVAWKPIEGKHLLEASKGSENQEYAVDIDVSDKGSVIELIWWF